MPLEVRSTIEREQTALRQLAERLPQVRRSVLTRMGQYLVGRERKHFLDLTKSGSSNGVTWPKDAPITMEQRRRMASQGMLADPNQIGVRSGGILNGFRFHVDADATSVTVLNRAPYANAFNSKRPIFPPSLPDSWLAGCERIAQATLDKETP